jgi:hypothetical protein
MNPIIPSPDALPVPGPIWLFEFLLHLTFVLHLLTMNALAGGFLLTLWSRFRGGDDHNLLVAKLSKLLPTLFAATVTLGVAPLLFAQVIYGNFFYTSSVIMAWPWFSIVLILIFAYYGAYMNSFSGEKLGKWRNVVIASVTLMIFFVGWIFSNNMTLMISPDRWPALYFANQSGTNWNIGDPQLVSRYLHMMISAIAVSGLLASLIGWKNNNQFITKHGLKVFSWFTAVNIAVGTLFWLSLNDVTSTAVGKSIPFMIGSTVGVIALITAFIAIKKNSSPLPTLILTVTTVIMMVLTRDLVRKVYLSDYYKPELFEVQPQLLNIIIFLVLFVAGIATIVWMAKQLFSAK